MKMQFLITTRSSESNQTKPSQHTFKGGADVCRLALTRHAYHDEWRWADPSLKQPGRRPPSRAMPVYVRASSFSSTESLRTHPALSLRIFWGSTIRACQLLLFSSSVSCCHGERCSSHRREGLGERAQLGSEPAAFVLECSSVDRSTWLGHDLTSKYGSNPGNDNNDVTCRSIGPSYITLDSYVGVWVKEIPPPRWRWNFGSWTDVILCE